MEIEELDKVITRLAALVELDLGKDHVVGVSYYGNAIGWDFTLDGERCHMGPLRDLAECVLEGREWLRREYSHMPANEDPWKVELEVTDETDDHNYWVPK